MPAITSKNSQEHATLPQFRCPSTSDCCCKKLPPPSPHVTACQYPSPHVSPRRVPSGHAGTPTGMEGTRLDGWAGGVDGKERRGPVPHPSAAPKRALGIAGYGAVRVPSTRAGPGGIIWVLILLWVFSSIPRARAQGQGLGDFGAQPAKIRPLHNFYRFSQDLTGCKLVAMNLDQPISFFWFQVLANFFFIVMTTGQELGHW